MILHFWINFQVFTEKNQHLGFEAICPDQTDACCLFNDSIIEFAINLNEKFHYRFNQSIHAQRTSYV